MELSNDRLLRQKIVTLETGLPRSTLYYLMARGEFPKPVKLSRRAVAWNSRDVQAWKESRKAA